VVKFFPLLVEVYILDAKKFGLPGSYNLYVFAGVHCEEECSNK